LIQVKGPESVNCGTVTLTELGNCAARGEPVRSPPTELQPALEAKASFVPAFLAESAKRVPEISSKRHQAKRLRPLRRTLLSAGEPVQTCHW
jgi:hypothetical protein